MNSNTAQQLCHNPACHRPIHRRDAFLRSVSLVQVAFCSKGCVEMFDALDAAAGHHHVPAQREATA